jgi:hypothetical protein
MIAMAAGRLACRLISSLTRRERRITQLRSAGNHGDLPISLSKVRPQLRTDVFVREISAENQTDPLSQLQPQRGGSAYFFFEFKAAKKS